ncbi:MAG: hypothetical protein J6S02_04485 [Bacteroidaceae bacterium]|nr:hypothetical protein [Bacteroidaceae bacterium]
MKSALKSIWKLGLIYALLTPVMCYFEVAYVAGGMSMVKPLIVLPTIFFVMTLVSLSVYHYVQENKPKYLTLFHMVNNVARLLITLVLALVYLFLILQECRGLFIINLLIFYLVALFFTSVHFIVCERKQKHSSSN